MRSKKDCKIKTVSIFEDKTEFQRNDLNVFKKLKRVNPLERPFI